MSRREAPPNYLLWSAFAGSVTAIGIAAGYLLSTQIWPAWQRRSLYERYSDFLHTNPCAVPGLEISADVPPETTINMGNEAIVTIQPNGGLLIIQSNGAIIIVNPADEDGVVS